MVDRELLKKIYSKTDGCCHICHQKVLLKNYGRNPVRGAWQIEHSIPKAQGGTDHLNNLYPACIVCNRDKGTRSSRTARSQFGNQRAPYSKTKKKEIKDANTTAGAIIGGIIGSTIGPWGIAIGATIGGMIGNSNTPNK